MGRNPLIHMHHVSPTRCCFEGSWIRHAVMVCAGSSAVVALLHAHLGCALHVGYMRSQLSCLVSDPEVIIFPMMTTTLDIVRRDATMCEVCSGTAFLPTEMSSSIGHRHVVSSRNMSTQVEHNTLIVVARALERG
jgi:hypothetical protein